MTLKVYKEGEKNNNRVTKGETNCKGLDSKP